MKLSKGRRGAAGFIITFELLLVMVLVVFPILIGLYLLGQKLFTLYLNKREFDDQPYSRAVVWDSSATPKVIGPVIGYDAFEAPLVIFRDEATGGGVVLGVRTDRFTSYGEVFFTGIDCQGTRYIRAYDKRKVTLSGNLPTGHLYQMQGRSYAVGPTGGSDPEDPSTHRSVLYASSLPSPTLAPAVLSYWRSQDVTKNTPCFPVVGDVDGLVAPDVVIDFENGTNYVRPFRLAFPTPGAMPVAPPGPGEG